MTEEKLAYQCKKQDPLAQKELYETYYIEMKRLVMRYIKEQDEVFDCLSKGFYSVLTKIDQFSYRGVGSLGAWVRRIMINEALANIRASKKELFLVADDQMDTDVGYEEADVSYLYHCIQRLPDGARAIFNLVAVEGYSHKEAAQLMAISEGTSRSQLVYARNKIKELLKGN